MDDIVAAKNGEGDRAIGEERRKDKKRIDSLRFAFVCGSDKQEN